MSSSLDVLGFAPASIGRHHIYDSDDDDIYDSDDNEDIVSLHVVAYLRSGDDRQSISILNFILTMTPSRPREVLAANQSSFFSSRTMRLTWPVPSTMSISNTPAATIESSRIDDRWAPIATEPASVMFQLTSVYPTEAPRSCSHSASWMKVTPASNHTEPPSMSRS
ncbi:hypothetical protein BN1708_015234 [Verticillium longisporum]|uniref:Uncharacterized protein n=1 Tax=Verticillium longisporum TaxID=100787 RepID=A0A0G4M2P9_VERLO|nr:hypothetical protein BN1708_015234 [Verticillium longisporum]